MRSTSISPRSCDRHVLRSWRLGLWLLAGCAELPGTVPVEDLSGLARRYEQPTATIPGALVGRVIRQTTEHPELAQQLDGLRLVYTAVTEAASRLAKEGDADEFALHGTVDVTHACPGHGPEPAQELADGGAIHLTLNVRDSFVQRGAEGRVADCRFKVNRRGVKTEVELDAARLGVDLGEDTRIGSKIRPVLMVRLRDVSADIVSERAGLLLLHDQYDLRVSEDRIETLIDMSTLGLAELGTAVLIASKDGSFGLREKRGEWQCDRAEDSCELKR